MYQLLFTTATSRPAWHLWFANVCLDKNEIFFHFVTAFMQFECEINYKRCQIRKNYNSTSTCCHFRRKVIANKKMLTVVIFHSLLKSSIFQIPR